ncbi:hypothetical protein K435DRAFT_781109 [Dendrothele bispora CBS 962.96]|uniref:Uncharacterized protein n=1 Tax=Dendrothele bispora (strain CBS 962.96) TaxID=1314807 RepID=A0A4S8LMU2_DENBC|nr:hypothetical protein K435DRAFT_781109 [Dendrothele bispora CBS 962.96]
MPHATLPFSGLQNLLEAVHIAKCIQQDTAESTRNKHWVERLASRASRVVSSARGDEEKRVRGRRSSSGSGADVELELMLAFGERFEDLLEHLENIKRDLEIYEALDDVAALINKEKDLRDHCDKLRAWKTKFNLAAIKIARMTRHKRERTDTNEATTNRTNSGTTPTHGPARVRGNSQKVTMTFSSSSISDPVINNCGGDSISTSNVHGARITIAKKVVNVKHYHAVGLHQRRWRR